MTAGVRFDVPVDLDREEARRRATEELSKGEYRQDDDPWPIRAISWLLERFDELLNRLSEVTPGGPFGLVVLVVLAVLAVVAIRLGLGPFARTAAADQPLFVGRTRSASAYRAAAEQAAAAQDWDTAVAERFRAVVRGLEERGVLDARPGRTADEAARDAGTAYADRADDLRGAADTFDQVRYGGRHADAAAYRRVRELDDSLTATRVR